MTWNLAPPPGFQGLHPDKPVTVYQRHLPHWRQAGASYFVTFRLADSLPQNRLDELKHLRTEWERKNPPPRSNEQWDELWKEDFRRVDQWLDEGVGSCHFHDVKLGQTVANALHYFDGDRYELGCSVVMPNHVHLIVRPFDDHVEALSKITHSWKRHTALEINRLFNSSGEFWQKESHDRIIRDEEHLWKTIQYLKKNPEKSGLNAEACHLWLSPAWQKLGWRFED